MCMCVCVYNCIVPRRTTWSRAQKRRMDAAVEDDRKDMVVKTNLQYQPKFLFFSLRVREERARRTNRAEGKKERGGGEEKERVKKERKKRKCSRYIFQKKN